MPPTVISARQIANDSHYFSDRRKRVKAIRSRPALKEALPRYNGWKKTVNPVEFVRFLRHARRNHKMFRKFYGSIRHRRWRFDRSIAQQKAIAKHAAALVEGVRGLDTNIPLTDVFGDAAFRVKPYWPRGRGKKHYPKPPFKKFIHAVRQLPNVTVKVVTEKWTSSYCYECRQ
jgi:hypothetical protein